MRYDVNIWWRGNPSRPVDVVRVRASSRKEALAIAGRDLPQDQYAEGTHAVDEYEE